MRGDLTLSSAVPKRERTRRDPRRVLSDFNVDERACIEAVRQSFTVDDVVVLGSRARGDWADDSDIDLGVEGYKPLAHRSLIEVLNSRLPLKIDLFKFGHALTHKGAIIV